MSTKDNYMLEEIRYKYVWKFAMFTFILTGYFAVETYNAELTTSLTKKEIKMPILRLEDIQENDMLLSLPKGTFYVTLFEFAGDGDHYKDIWNTKVVGKEYGVVQQTEESTIAALKDNYVVLTFGEIAFTYKNNNPCLIEIVPNDPLLESQNQIGMYLQKNSPFTQMFKNQLGTMHESGVVSIVTKDEGNGAMKECQGLDLVLNLASCIFLFVCIAVGVALAFIILIIEIIFDKLGIFKLHTFYFYTE